MSAINPASFASPSLGLQAPSGIGPGAVGVTRNPHLPERRHPQPPEPSAYGHPPAGRGFSYGQQFPPSVLERGPLPPTQFSPSAYTYGYSAFGAPRNVGISPGGYLPMDQFGGYPPGVEYQQSLPGSHSNAPTRESNDFSRSSTTMGASGEGWVNSFQGLSMNTR